MYDIKTLYEAASVADAVRLLESGAALSELEAVLNPGLGSVPFL